MILLMLIFTDINFYFVLLHNPILYFLLFYEMDHQGNFNAVHYFLSNENFIKLAQLPYSR